MKYFTLTDNSHYHINDFILWKARVRCGVVGVADGDGSGVRGGGRSVGGCSRVMRGR